MSRNWLNTNTVQTGHTRKAKPHILVLAYAFPVRSETFIVDHVRGLMASGALVTVAAWSIDLEALASIEQRYGVRISAVCIPNGIRHFRRLFRSLGSIRAGPRNLGIWLKSPDLRDATTLASGIGTVIRQLRPDLIHAHFGPLGVSAALALKRTSIPIVVNFHGYDATLVPHRSGWSTYRPLVRPGVRLIAHSRFIAERLAPVGLPVERVQMGYDAQFFFPADQTDGQWPEPLRLILIGRLVPQKGQRVALEAMTLLRDKGYDIRLCLVGAGPDEEALGRYCTVLELTDYVEFAGGLAPNEVARKLRDSDILLAPSQISLDGSEEGFGRAVIEGIACGLPAVVFPTGGLADTVGGAGTVCLGTTANELVNGIEATILAGDRSYWRTRCLSASAGRSLDAMWADYERVTREALAATVA